MTFFSFSCFNFYKDEGIPIFGHQVDFAVTASVQIVGVYLVFASLIIPALATRRLQGRVRLIAGYSVGALSYAIGIGLSAILDLPTGAVIVWTMQNRTLSAPYLSIMTRGSGELPSDLLIFRPCASRTMLVK